MIEVGAQGPVYLAPSIVWDNILVETVYYGYGYIINLKIIWNE